MKRVPQTKALTPYVVHPPSFEGVDLFKVGMGDRSFAIVSFPIPASAAPPVRLSPSEVAVMKLALGGASNGEIARSRRTSARTIANQLASLFRKLGVSSRSELAAYATWFAPAQDLATAIARGAASRGEGPR